MCTKVCIHRTSTCSVITLQVMTNLKKILLFHELNYTLWILYIKSHFRETFSVWLSLWWSLSNPRNSLQNHLSFLSHLSSSARPLFRALHQNILNHANSLSPAGIGEELIVQKVPGHPLWLNRVISSKRESSHYFQVY